MMNEFLFLAGHSREHDADLAATSTRLADTLCGLLHQSHTFRGRELDSLLCQRSQ